MGRVQALWGEGLGRGARGKTAPRGQQPEAHPLCRHFLCLWAHPVHLDHIRVPVLGFYSLWVQLQRKEEREHEGDADGCSGASQSSLLASSCSYAGYMVRKAELGPEASLEINPSGRLRPPALLSWLVKDSAIL